MGDSLDANEDWEKSQYSQEGRQGEPAVNAGAPLLFGHTCGEAAFGNIHDQG